MVDSPRAFIFAVALVVARAHIASHDNILRIQLWDGEGLSKVPISTDPPPVRAIAQKSGYKTKVNLDTLYNAMLNEGYNSPKNGRFSRHRYRHRRRRPRDSGTDLPWKFHSGDRDLNVAVYDEDVPWSVIEDVNSEVSDVEQTGRGDPAPERLVQDDEEEEVKKKLPVVPKCCPSGQNLSMPLEDGKRVCAPSMLTFQPLFFQSNDTHMWPYDSNVFETIVGNPCIYDRYKLDPNNNSEDDFYLLINGSLRVFVPPILLGTRDYCMETFWNESNPAGDTLPLVCFAAPVNEAKTSETLIAYAVGLIISVPFLLATSCVYTFIRELRDVHGKALACHSTCLAIAFSCLAATQLAGHAFPLTVCTIMAYLIQFSFVSCFFWLNVMCFDTYLNVRRYISANVTRRSMRRRFAWYCAYAVLLPFILLIVTVTMDLSPAVPSTYLKPNFGVKGCWFKTDQAALPYFYGPVATILLSNIVIFILTSRAFAVHYDKLKDVTAMDLAHSDYSTDDDWVRLGVVLGEPVTLQDRSATPPGRPVNMTMRLKKYRKIFRTCCLLSAIMGLSWVMEVVSWAVGAGSSVMSVWSIFDVINALQGVVVFAIYVLQQPMRSLIKKRLCRNYSSSETAVVSERTSIDCGSGRRDYV